MKTIYLAGNIASCDALESKKRFKHNVQVLSEAGYRVIDPTRGKVLYPLVDGRSGKMGHCFAPYYPNEITYRDMYDVMSADIIVADIQDVSLGIGAELGVAWYLKKPIIVITQNREIREHPFVQTFAMKIVNTVEDAKEFLLHWKV